MSSSTPSVSSLFEWEFTLRKTVSPRNSGLYSRNSDRLWSRSNLNPVGRYLSSVPSLLDDLSIPTFVLTSEVR